MTGWERLSLRAQAALDRWAWGLGDLKRVLMERSAWPAAARAALAADGGRWSIVGTRALQQPGSRKAAAFLVPESDCLWGTLQLPDLPRHALAGGVEEALWRVSPMPPERVVAAWWAEPLANGGWTVEWGICRSNHLAQQLAQHGFAPDAPVYLLRHGRSYPVRNPAWLRQEARQRWMDWGGCALLLAVLAALALPALMPLVLKREAVVRAVAHVGSLEPQAAPLRQKMDDLRQQVQLAEELRTNAGTDLPLASVIEALSVAIPADTWLDRVEVNGSEIRITGLTANATDLIGQLGRQPAFGDLRATGANVRDATLNKERFTFEMRWRGEGGRP